VEKAQAEKKLNEAYVKKGKKERRKRPSEGQDIKKRDESST